MSHSLVVTLYIYMSDEWMSLVLSSLLVHSDHFVPMQEIVFFSKNCRALRPISVITCTSDNSQHVYAEICMMQEYALW